MKQFAVHGGDEMERAGALEEQKSIIVSSVIRLAVSAVVAFVEIHSQKAATYIYIYIYTGQESLRRYNVFVLANVTCPGKSSQANDVS